MSMVSPPQWTKDLMKLAVTRFKGISFQTLSSYIYTNYPLAPYIQIKTVLFKQFFFSAKNKKQLCFFHAPINKLMASVFNYMKAV